MGCCCGDGGDGGRGGNNVKLNQWEPLKKRSCTDVVPLIVFCAFFVGMVIITSYSVISGAADRLIYGFDSYGNICNKLNKPLINHTKSGRDLRGKPMIFFMDVRDADKSLEICVERCPDDKLNTMQDVIDFHTRTGVGLCDYDIPVEEYSKQANSKTGPCPVLEVPDSTPVLFRCLPDYLPEFFVYMVSQLNNIPILNAALADLYLTRHVIMLLSLVAFVQSILTVLLIRFWASLVVIVINVVLSLSALGVTGIMWWMYASTEHQLDLKPFNVTLRIEEADKDAFFWYSIITTVGTVILILLMLVMRKRVALVVELFYEAGKCLTAMPSLFLQPVFTFLILIIFWSAWLVVFGCLATAGEMQVVDEEKGYVKFIRTHMITYMWWFHLVGLFWITEFILACQQMVIAGAVAEWFFCRNKKKLEHPILSSMTRLITNHLGSCAFGAFFIVLVALPRYILMYIYRQCKDSENVVAKFVLKCCICCMWLLEKILRYLNYNAYSLVAINGTNFCKSACDAVQTILSSPLRVAAINSVGSFVLFLGKLLVGVTVAGICGVLVLRNYNDINFIAAPVGVVFIFAFLIASCFLTIYEMCIDTLFLCFCEDSRVNDGSSGKQYFMSTSLMNFVRRGSRRINKLEGKRPPVGSGESMEMLDVRA